MTAQPDDFWSQVDLADTLTERFFHRIGDDVPLAEALDDLDGAIAVLGALLDLAPGDVHREIAGELGYLLRVRFDLGPADGDDLDTAIRLLRDATGDDPDPDIAAELGGALASRYDLDADDADRDEAIAVLRPVCDSGDDDPALLAECAELLAERGEDRSDMSDITAAIGYAERSVPLLPDDSPNLVTTLYILGIGHFLRAGKDPASAPADWHAAVVALGRVRDMLPPDEPWRVEVSAWYGMALTARVAGLSETLRMSNALRRRADEAIRVLSECEPGIADDTLRLRVRHAAAQCRALRYLTLDGPADDQRMALAELTEISGLPGCDPEIANGCHYMCATLLLGSPVDDDARRRVNRYDAVAHRQLMRRIQTHTGPAPENASKALGHLDQIQEPDAAGLITACEVLDLRAFATLQRREGGSSEEDLRSAMALAEQAIKLTPEGDPDLGMRQAMASFIRGELASRQGRPDDYSELVQGLVAAAEKLAPAHRMQPMILGMLGEFASRHSPGRSPSRAAGIAAAELVEQALREVPADHPARVMILTRLGEILLGHTVFDHSTAHLDRIRGLLREAIAQPAADETNNAVNHYLLGLTDGVASVFGGDFQRFDVAVSQLKIAAGLAPRQDPLRIKILIALAVMLRNRHLQDRNLEWLDASDHYATAALAALRESSADPDGMMPVLERQLMLAPVMRQISRLDQSGAPQTVETAIRQLEGLAARIPAGHELQDSIADDMQLLRLMSTAGRAAGLGATANIRQAVAAASAAAAAIIPHGVRQYDTIEPLALALAGHAKVGDGFARNNRRLVNEGLNLLLQAWDAVISAPSGNRWRGSVPAVLHLLSKGLLGRYYLTGDRADLSHAIVRLEDAHREIREGPIGALPAAISFELAEAYRVRDDPNLGDRRRAATSGMRVLHDFAKDVLLQSTADRAFEAALNAADKASVIARWCLEAGLPEAAVEALEMGRGMVLHAATTEATVPALLREAGRQDLAAEWEAAADGVPTPWDQGAGPAELAGLLTDLPHAPVPSDLRQRVIAAIEDTQTERNLLAPPGTGEIAAALRGARVDALAYLVPSTEDAAGLAVLVGVDGNVRSLPLPRIAASSKVIDVLADAQREWLAAERERDEEAAVPARRRWRGALADLCDWAWTAAMDPLLHAVSAAPDRPARLVLVPVGKLGLVPWHAARRAEPPAARRYACQDAIISYVASARQYVTARRGVPRRWTAEPALVTVDNNLYWTRRGIGRIHRRYYPDGVLLGGREATAQNMRELLPRPGSPGASLLHIGTHGEPAEHPLGSRLRLQGEDYLSMTDLLRQARGRPADVPGGLVVLAACGTDLTGHAHDEALTLASAFLALGAAGAVGTRWPVKDVPTAVFMTVFHHQLNSGQEDPAAAVRAAQLWMIDPERVVPDSIDPALAEQMRTIDLDAVDNWVAYTYQGR